MSLINKMLKDIDQRSSTDQEAKPQLLNQVRAVKRSSKDSSRFIVLSLLGASALGLAAYYLSDQFLKPAVQSGALTAGVGVTPPAPPIAPASVPASTPAGQITAAADSPQTTTASTASVTPFNSVGSSGGAVTGDAADVTEAQKIISLTRDWAAAWSAKNFIAYIGFYSEQFSPANNLSRDQWAESRRARIARPASISVQLSDIAAEKLTDNQFAVRFNQRYRSDNFSENSEKTLIWQQANNDWKIVREDVNQTAVTAAAREAIPRPQAAPKETNVTAATVVASPPRTQIQPSATEKDFNLPNVSKTARASDWP